MLPKMAWEILQIFTRAHSKVWKDGLLSGLFMKNRKCVNLQFTENLCIIKINNDAKIEENLTCHSKLTWRIWWFFTRAFENLKNVHFNGLLLTKVYNVWAKKVEKYRGVIFHCTEDWCKIWRKTGLYFLEWHEDFGKFSPKHIQKSKNWDFTGSFYPK